MPGSLDLPEFNVNPERVDALKLLRKGVGIEREIADFPYALFGVGDRAQLISLLSDVSAQMPAWRSSRAIHTALNLHTSTPRQPAMLGERRSALAREWEVAERTVIRLEERGAQLLDYYLQYSVGNGLMALYGILRRDGFALGGAVERTNFLGANEASAKVNNLIREIWDTVQPFHDQIRDEEHALYVVRQEQLFAEENSRHMAVLRDNDSGTRRADPFRSDV